MSFFHIDLKSFDLGVFCSSAIFLCLFLMIRREIKKLRKILDRLQSEYHAIRFFPENYSFSNYEEWIKNKRGKVQ